MRIEPRQTVENFRPETERLAGLAYRRLSAIADHVRRHPGASSPVLFVNVLYDALAVVARRQVDVDVRILLVFFRKETLEKKVVLDRIDRRYPERVADDGIRRRAASLREYLVRFAVVGDVVDDEEVARKLLHLDHAKFFLKPRQDL